LLKIAKSLSGRRVLVPIGFAIGASLGALAIRGIDWTEIRAQIGEASPAAVIVALALAVASAYVRALRWRLLFVGHPVRTLRLFLVENAALGLNNVSPVHLLDEPAILTMLTLRDRVPGSLVVATMVMSRMQDLGVTLLFAVIALVVEPTLPARVLPSVVAGVAFAVLFIALLKMGWLSRRFSLLGRIPGVNRFDEAIKMMLSFKRRLAATVLLTAGYWLLLGPMAFLLARGMGVELKLLQATILVLGTIFFATAVPGLPGALGTFELAVVELSGFWGVPQPLAVGYALVLHLVLFLPQGVIAVLVLPREGLWFGRKPWVVHPDTVEDTFIR
jgi:uncharacterized protein (TIRG00374 family)